MEQTNIQPGISEQGASQLAEQVEQTRNRLDWERYAPQPTILTLQDLADLPKQILPEATYTHLVNAGKETKLACTSLLNSLGHTFNSVLGSSTNAPARTRKHIDIE